MLYNGNLKNGDAKSLSKYTYQNLLEILLIFNIRLNLLHTTLKGLSYENVM